MKFSEEMQGESDFAGESENQVNRGSAKQTYKQGRKKGGGGEL